MEKERRVFSFDVFLRCTFLWALLQDEKCVLLIEYGDLAPLHRKEIFTSLKSTACKKGHSNRQKWSTYCYRQSLTVANQLDHFYFRLF